jgi:uncharacterized protein YbjQ (UPF0145 family)
MKNSLFCVMIIIFALLLTTGCVKRVFNEPVTLSTKSIDSRHFTPIDQVSGDYTTGVIILIPIVADPRDIYDELLDNAKGKGGNAVVDLQLRNRSFWGWIFPPFVFSTMEVEGTAVSIK